MGLVAVLLSGGAAEAQLFDSIFGSPYGYRRYVPAQPNAYRPKRKQLDTARKQTVKPPPGPLLIAISLNSQRLTLYANGAAVAHSPVSTGTPSHPTPTGIFSVIQKNRHHRSNLYSNAPMPFMQRITWSGVALHQGVLPGYPASHGCIRLPASFAAYLWGTTRIGTGARVIITRDEVAPVDIAHARLFVPKPKSDEDVVAQSAEQAPAVRVKVAETEGQTASDAERETKPVLVAGGQEAGAPTLKGPLDTIAPATSGAAQEARAPAPAIGRAKSAPAREAGDPVDPQTPSRTAVDMAPRGEAAGDAVKPGRQAAEVKDIPRMSEPVSVFISRKAGRLYVRQGYEPVFDTPVTIHHPDMPIGTHLYTALEFSEDRTAMRWNAVTLSARTTSEPERRPGETRAQRLAREDEAARAARAARPSPSAALDRVEIPQDAVERIAELMSPGASLIISDHPISGETGKYTDFIVLTR